MDSIYPRTFAKFGHSDVKNPFMITHSYSPKTGYHVFILKPPPFGARRVMLLAVHQKIPTSTLLVSYLKCTSAHIA